MTPKSKLNTKESEVLDDLIGKLGMANLGDVLGIMIPIMVVVGSRRRRAGGRIVLVVVGRGWVILGGVLFIDQRLWIGF